MTHFGHGFRRLLACIALTALSCACRPMSGPNGRSTTPHVQATGAAKTAPAFQKSSKTVFLDPGHGGIDWGAIAQRPDGTWLGEKTFTLDIGLRTAALLKTEGYKVVLSRDQEAPATQWPVNYPPRDLNGDGKIDDIDDVQARINIANQAHADILLSIHLNAATGPNNGPPAPSFNGVTTLYDPDRPFSGDNQRLATLVQKQMLTVMAAALGHAPHDWGIADDTTLPTPFTTARTSYHHDVELGPSEPGWVDASQMPGVISEPLFLTNPDDQAAVLRDDVRQQIAEGYVHAIDAYFAGGATN